MSWIPRSWWKPSDYEFLAEVEARKNHISVLESMTKFIDESDYDIDEYSSFIPRIVADKPSKSKELKIEQLVKKPITTIIEADPKQRVVITARERAKILRVKGGICHRCSKKTDLQIHHIDKDPSNNKQWNLELLCYSCHKKVHARLHHEVRRA